MDAGSSGLVPSNLNPVPASIYTAELKVAWSSLSLLRGAKTSLSRLEEVSANQFAESQPV